MKRTLALVLALCMLLCLTGCKRKNKKETAPAAPAVPTPTPNEVFEVKLSLDNLFTYFDYKEYRADVRDENSSEIDSSTIAYGLQLIPSRVLPLYLLNPMTPIVAVFRCAMFGFGYFDLTYYLISWAVTIAVFILGIVLFSRIERTFMDTI